MRRLSILVFVAAVASASPALGFAPPQMGDLFGTRSLGMGNAFRAVGTSNEALYFNPAGVVVTRRYQVDGHYGFSPGDRMTLWNASIVDSKTANVGVGIGYSHLSGMGGPLETSGSLVHFGLGVPLSSRVAMGVNFKYLGFSRPEDTNSVTADAGLIVRPLPILSLGVVGYNLIDVASDLAPMRVGGGISVGNDTLLRLSFDAVFALEEGDPLGTTYHAGAEYFFDGVLPIRIGAERREGEDRNFLTAGIGLVSPMAALEAGFAQGVGGGGRSDERIFSFALKLFL
ncbi:MAG TPA: hypothetical protein VKY51_06340 [Fredinandcohnia sp.]|nr:hypothetical protein [Fredinandcohnia sp.]